MVSSSQDHMIKLLRMATQYLGVYNNIEPFIPILVKYCLISEKLKIFLWSGQIPNFIIQAKYFNLTWHQLFILWRQSSEAGQLLFWLFPPKSSSSPPSGQCQSIPECCHPSKSKNIRQDKISIIKLTNLKWKTHPQGPSEATVLEISWSSEQLVIFCLVRINFKLPDQGGPQWVEYPSQGDQC